MAHHDLQGLDVARLEQVKSLASAPSERLIVMLEPSRSRVPNRAGRGRGHFRSLRRILVLVGPADENARKGMAAENVDA